MIKNVIFDVGGVLMDFDTMALTRSLTENEEDAVLLHAEVFDHPDWISTDRGVPETAVIASLRTHLPERLHAPAEELLARWDEWVVPNPEINELAVELDSVGINVYILSNTSAGFYRFRERIPAWPVVKGCILSYEEKLLKPDLEIYRRLLSRFGLAPNECFFVDDNHLNVEAACWCGMGGEIYRHDAARLRASLRAAGVPVAP